MSSKTPRLKQNPSLRLEGLEAREVPATGIFLSDTGILRMEGTTGQDLFQVSANNQGAGKSVVTANLKADNGQVFTQSFDASKIKSIEVVGKGGQDTFLNTSGIAAKTSTSNNGWIGSNLNAQIPANALGVFTVGQSGVVSVDYLFRGAGYSGQVGIFSLSGMETLDPKSADFRKEAANRVLSNSEKGALIIDATSEGARYSASTAWEGDLNTFKKNYVGIREVKMNPGDRFVIMLVPQGRFSDVAKNPSVGGATQPLFSLPAANPLPDRAQFNGQIGEYNDSDGIFAFEDLRLDQTSDRDYNDVVFQILGAKGNATPIKEVINKDRNFLETSVVRDRILPTGEENKKDYEKKHGKDDDDKGGEDEDFEKKLGKGTFKADNDGKVQLDFLYDGGGFVGEMGIYSLDGMTAYEPGSPAFIQEVARRVMTGSTLGYLAISDFSEGAKNSDKLATDGLFNRGDYQGVKTFQLEKNAKFGMVLIPNATFWEIYNNPNATGAKRALFSHVNANPTQAINGGVQLADITGEEDTFGWEDQRLDGNSDRDYNDIIFRLIGAKSEAEDYKNVANPSKSILKDANYPKIIA